ncbi:MAG: FAD:protein FMN transferase, partial [Planctomycetales bacterium]|nr:FAD:protein FMN transferase [Planctomycetales bacterium]
MLGLDGTRLYGDDPQGVARGRLVSRTKTTHALGTEVSITALHDDGNVATHAIDQAFAELRLVEDLMSVYQPDSQLSRLNRERAVEAPHPYFVQVLRVAERMSRQSDGAFDVTVQPLWSLFAAAKKTGRLPADDAIEAARRKVDWRQVEVAAESVRLRGEATITLNGIAQGFAADRA